MLPLPASPTAPAVVGLPAWTAPWASFLDLSCERRTLLSIDMGSIELHLDSFSLAPATAVCVTFTPGGRKTLAAPSISSLTNFILLFYFLYRKARVGTM